MFRKSPRKLLYVDGPNITFEPVAQYPMCQYLDPLKYFNFKESPPMQIYLYVRKVENMGVSFYFEDRNRASRRRQKSNMLAYSGPTFENNDLDDPVVMRYSQINDHDLSVKVRL